MKKNYVLGMFALVALTMVGCSNDEVVNDYSQDNAIQFGTYMGRNAQARGAMITTESLQESEEGFGVFAYYHQEDYTAGDEAFEANFMNNQQVTYNNEGWTYNPLKYWPNNDGDKVSFIAYAPWHEDATFPTKGLLEYTVDTDVLKQEDLLWSKSQNFNLTKYDQTIDGEVKFVFAHALSKVDFTISAGVDLTEVGGELAEGTTIYVDEVKIVGLNQTGTLDLSAATATWSNLKTPVEYVWGYTYNNDEKTYLRNNILTADAGTTKKPLLKENDYYLLAIPQVFSEDFKIVVTYRVFTEDEALTGTINEKDDATGSLITNVITVSEFGSFTQFEAGKQYKFNIILGMTSVQLDVEVAEWENEVEEDVWFNENKAGE